MHAMNTEFDARFDDAIPLGQLQGIIVQLDGGQHAFVARFTQFDGVADQSDSWRKLVIIGVVHPDIQVHDDLASARDLLDVD